MKKEKKSIKNLIFTLLGGALLALPILGFAQKAPSVHLNGFVRYEAYVDSRAVATARDGNLLLYPLPQNVVGGNDLNGANSWNFQSILTRLQVNLKGGEAFGAKIFGRIEADFFGGGNAVINHLRLRQAYAQLNWGGKTKLLLGQTYHPSFVVANFPGVIGFNTGMPFNPFALSPQVRLNTKLGGAVDFQLALVGQRDFTNSGGNGALRNSIPALNLQLTYSSKSFLLGVVYEYKSLKPGTFDGATGAELSEKANGSTIFGHLKYKSKPLTLKLYGGVFQLNEDQIMLSAWGRANDGSYETAGNTVFWGEIHGNGKKVQPGLFVGYSSLGTFSNDVVALSGRNAVGGKAIQGAFRVSPRMYFLSGKLKFGIEVEYTRLTYEKTSGSVNARRDFSGVTTENVANVRAHFLTVYSF